MLVFLAPDSLIFPDHFRSRRLYLSIMNKPFIIILLVLASTRVQAQFIKEESTDVSIGLGLSAPYDQMDLLRSPGFYAQGEYVLSPASWIDIRPYAGVILTKLNKDDPERVEARYRSTANAVLLGGKTRIIAPVPFVAPYLEIGIGASIGSFETFTPYTSIDESGVFAHVPFSLGFELGSRHNADIKFTYYFHPGLGQFTGAAAVGFSFPLYP